MRLPVTFSGEMSVQICAGYFSGCRDQGPGRSLSQKETVILAHGLRRAVVDCGKAVMVGGVWGS